MFGCEDDKRVPQFKLSAQEVSPFDDYLTT